MVWLWTSSPVTCRERLEPWRLTCECFEVKFTAAARGRRGCRGLLATSPLAWLAFSCHTAAGGVSVACCVPLSMKEPPSTAGFYETCATLRVHWKNKWRTPSGINHSSWWQCLKKVIMGRWLPRWGYPSGESEHGGPREFTWGRSQQNTWVMANWPWVGHKGLKGGAGGVRRQREDRRDEGDGMLRVCASGGSLRRGRVAGARSHAEGDHTLQEGHS